MTIDLAGDLLDKRIQDRNGRYMGTVDSVVLEAGKDGAAKVVAIEIGLPVLARRLHPRLERWARRFPLTRLPIAKLRLTGSDIQADVDAERHSTLLAIEKWLRSHIVERIPGHAR